MSSGGPLLGEGGFFGGGGGALGPRGSYGAYPTCGCSGLLMVIAGPGMTSHHAEYGAKPLLTSCSVPAWMRVLSVVMHNASTHPPPMPTQVAEYSASPGLCAVAVGTVQSPDTWWNIVPLFSSVPWL